MYPRNDFTGYLWCGYSFAGAFASINFPIVGTRERGRPDVRASLRLAQLWIRGRRGFSASRRTNIRPSDAEPSKRVCEVRIKHQAERRGAEQTSLRGAH